LEHRSHHSLELVGTVHSRASKREGDLDAGRIYWCRYENAIGQTWETRNPGDRSTDLIIRRVRFRRIQEWREARRRRKARADAEKLEDGIRQDLLSRRQ